MTRWIQADQVKRYEGVRGRGGTLVVVRHEPMDGPTTFEELASRRDLANLSLFGFDWGHFSEGASQLALALLADFAGEELAREHYQHFAADVVLRLPPERWELTDVQLEVWLQNHLLRCGAPALESVGGHRV